MIVLCNMKKLIQDHVKHALGEILHLSRLNLMSKIGKVDLSGIHTTPLVPKKKPRFIAGVSLLLIDFFGYELDDFVVCLCG